MGAKGIVFLGLILAVVLLISSEVAARELAETVNTVDTSKDAENTNEAAVDDAKYPDGGYGGGYGGRGGGYGGGRGGGYGGGGRGGGYGGGGRGGGYGGGCRYGRCCNYGRCRCCTYAGEKADANVQDKPHN